MPPPPIDALTDEEQRAVRDWIAGLAPPAGVATCVPRQERVCEGVGNSAWWPDLAASGDALDAEMTKACRAPVQRCSADGSEWGPCEGVFPAVEDCTTPEDEDCNLATPAQRCEDAAWTIAVTGERSQWLDSLDVDSEGNVYVLATFEGTVDFGGGVLTSDEPGGQYKNDVALAKYDRFGTHLWSRDFGDTSNQYGTQLTVDRDTGDVAVVMRLFGSVDFGPGSPTHTQSGGGDFVVALFDRNGEHRWSQRFGGGGVDRAERLAFARDNGDVIVTGKAGADPDLPLVIPGKGPISVRGQADGLVVRLGRAVGDVKWRYVAGGEAADCSEGEATTEPCGGDDDYAFGVDTDPNGDVYVAGRFEGYFDFVGLDSADGPSAVASLGQHDIFVVKLAGDTGTPTWSRRFGGAADDRAYDVTYQSGTGNILVAGYFGGSIDVGAAGGDESVPLEANGDDSDDDVLLLSLAAEDGHTVFAQGYGDAVSQFGVSHELGSTTRSLNLAVDAEDNIYLGGSLYGSFDGHIAAAVGATPKPDLFFVKLSPTGEYRNGRVHGGGGSEFAYDMAVDEATGGILLGGRFYGARLDLGAAGTALGVSEISNLFVAKWPAP
jgi:hypothetical protein